MDYFNALSSNCLCYVRSLILRNALRMVFVLFSLRPFRCTASIVGVLSVSVHCASSTPLEQCCTDQVEKELKEICRDVLDILDKHLIPAAGTGESKVFYYKMYVHSMDL